MRFDCWTIAFWRRLLVSEGEDENELRGAVDGDEAPNGDGASLEESVSVVVDEVLFLSPELLPPPKKPPNMLAVMD